MELEQQALIYKYITANVPIPSNLLLPIRKAFEYAHLSIFSSSFLRPNALGREAFHLGYSASSDLEPGRCRRTDGKKWRCSRDAGADGKYCERHMNRGRHHSRKPVEGQSGHSAAASAATTKNSKLADSSTSQASMVVGPQSSGRTNCLPINFQPTSLSNLSQASSLSRAIHEKENLITSESFLGNSHNRSSLTSGRNFGSVDDWTKKSESDTHLSISIPMVTVDYMPSTPSPANNERPLSSLRLSRDVSISSIVDLTNQRQASWIPISWGMSMGGGPLGEVLKNKCRSNFVQCRNSSALNLKDGILVLVWILLQPGSYRGQPSLHYQIAVQEVALELIMAWRIHPLQLPPSDNPQYGLIPF